jgi:opacity protein-like surface antigen
LPGLSAARDFDLRLAEPGELIVRNAKNLLIVLAAVAAAGPASAQVIDKVTELDWDRPEAWAMKYFNSVSSFTGLGAPRVRDRWSLEIGLELDTIPQLSEDQRRIGFDGTKVEDINRLPAFFRPRLTVGLPAKLSLDVAWVPPLEIRGVTSNLFAIGLERPFYESGPLVLGGRLTGQLGKVEGDFTCSEKDASFPPGDPGNIWGCEAPSEDELTLNHVAITFTGGYLVKKTRFHWGLAATYMDMEFQVNAVTFGVVDRSLLLADGWTWSVNGGASWQLNQRLSIATELFYGPLSVTRPPSIGSENDALFNLRSMLRIKL